MTVAIDVDNLRFEFPDGTAALRGTTFRVRDGECVGLIGPNGAGKSTLLLHLNGLLPDGRSALCSGQVRIFGRAIEPKSLPWIRRQVGLLFQDADDQLFCPTIGEDVAFGPSQLGLSRDEQELRVREALAAVGLSGFEARAPQRLSGGEKKRACLAGLLAYQPRVLVFDEPTSGLDPRGRRNLLEILKGLQSTRLIATHDLAMVAGLCSRVLVMDHGTIVADGPTETVLKDDELMLEHGLECPRLLVDLPAEVTADRRAT